MAYQVKGVVDRAFSKDKTSKAGRNVTINYIEVDGVTISTGFNAEHQAGEMVNIGVDKKFNEIQKVTANGEGMPPVAQLLSAPAPVAKGNFGGGGGGFKGRAASKFPIDPTDGQMSIIRQSSMNRAVEIVNTLITTDLFKPANEQEYLRKLLEIALIVADFGSGQDIMSMQAKMAERSVVNE